MWKILTAVALTLITSLSFAATAGGRYLCQVAWAAGTITTGTQVTTTLKCPGVSIGDFVDVSVNADRLLLTLTGYVNAAGSVTFIAYNPTGGSVVAPWTIAFASVTPKYISP